MLAVADGQHALARTLAHYEFESVRAGIDGDERGGAVIILSRSDGALPLAKIEGCDSVVGQHGKVAEFLARIVLGQARDCRRLIFGVTVRARMDGPGGGP